MVATEHERKLAGPGCGFHMAGDLGADGEDLVEVLGVLVALVERFDGILHDGAKVVHAEAQAGEPAEQLGVADRRRPHVDAAAALPEIECSAEDGDVGDGAHDSTLSLQEREKRLGERPGPARMPARRPAAAGSGTTTPPASRTSRSPARDPTRRGRARRTRPGGPRRPTRGRARPSPLGARRGLAAARARAAPTAARARPRRRRSPYPRARARAAGGADPQRRTIERATTASQRGERLAASGSWTTAATGSCSLRQAIETAHCGIP